jgi:isopentenyl phosphate kinase
MRKLILIKLGGSIITDKSKPFTARPMVIARLAREIKLATQSLKDTHFIISHGSGSFGHTIAAKYRIGEGNVHRDSVKGFCLTSETAVDINRIVLKEFLKAGIPVVSFSPLSFTYANKLFMEPILKAQSLGFVPLVYGDVVFDGVKGFAIHSGETTLDLIAQKLRKKYQSIKIIQCGDTDGVYDGEGKTIPEITSKNFKEVKKWILGSGKVDVTGGMIHKVAESLNLAKKTGIMTCLLNGNINGNLRKAILGKKVTLTAISS